MTKKHLFITKINQQENSSPALRFLTRRLKITGFLETLRGSSEAACRIAFQFSHFMTTKPEHNLHISTVFLTGFISFVETAVLFCN